VYVVVAYNLGSEGLMDVDSIGRELEQLTDADLQGVVSRILPRVMKAALAGVK